MKTKIKLGGPILVCTKLVRSKKQVAYGHKESNRIWVEKDIVPFEGIIIGVRTLTNGYSSWDGDTWNYEPLQWVKALVVVKSLSSAPFYILKP